MKENYRNIKQLQTLFWFADIENYQQKRKLNKMILNNNLCKIFQNNAEKCFITHFW